MYQVRAITKQYGATRALDGVDLEVRPGEVQALLGANGAGKSTLVKILVGAEQPTSGQLLLDEKQVQFRSANDAARHGIAVVSQELTLFPHLTALHNLFLMREPRRAGLIDAVEMRRRSADAVRAIGLDLDLDRRVETLGLAEQQLLEIARALVQEPRFLVLDEPTSALQAQEVERLHQVVLRLREAGVGVIYVSHNLEDVFDICDTVTVFRNGRCVLAREPAEALTIDQTVAHMLGPLSGGLPGTTKTATLVDPGDAAAEQVRAALTLDSVTVPGRLDDVTLTARAGEVIGLAGLAGSGPEAVIDVVYGRTRPQSGSVRLPSGKPGPRSMAAAVRSRVAHVPSDRKRLGLMTEKTVADNVTLVNAGPLRRMGVFLNRRTMHDRARFWGEQMSLKMRSPESLCSELSGGNQQKVVFAKWLESEPDTVLLHEPTRGVDIGAKAEMYAVVRSMARDGRVVLYVSGDLEEMAHLCDRVLVFWRGRVCGELAGPLSEHRLLEAITTGRVDLAALPSPGE